MEVPMKGYVLSVSPIGRHGAFRAVEPDTGRGRGTPGTAAMVGSIAEGQRRGLKSGH